MVQLIDLYRTSRHLNCEHAVFELISALEKGKRFDIYCPDIKMPGFTGIDAAKEIRTFDKTAPILFFTSSPEFALESYSVKVIIKGNEGIQKILISNLIFTEVIGRNVLYHLRSGKVIECTEAFSPVCDNLMKYGCFMKPHRSYLVNMQYVDTIENHQITLQTLSSVLLHRARQRR